MRVIKVIRRLFQEDHHSFITGIYREFLNRKPSPRKLDQFLNELENGGSRESLLKRLIASKEFERNLSASPRQRIFQILQETFGKNGYEFVKQLYREVFGREPNLQQLHQGEKLLRTKGKIEVVRNVLAGDGVIQEIPQSVQSGFDSTIMKSLHGIFQVERNGFIRGLCRELLDEDEPKQTTQVLQAGYSKIDIFRSMVRSRKFEQLVHREHSQSCVRSFQSLMRADDANFISEVYRVCLNREPQSVEFAYLIRCLKRGELTRTSLLRTIILSDEAVKQYVPQRSAIHAKKRGAPTLWPNVPVSITFRQTVQKALKKHRLSSETTLLINQGGMGDCIQITPVAKALKKKYPNRPVVAIVEHYSSLFVEHPYVDLAIGFRDLGLRNSRTVVKSLIGLTDNVIDLRYYVSRSYGTWPTTAFFEQNGWYYRNFPRSGNRMGDLNKHVCDLMLQSLGLEQYASCEDVYITPDRVPEEIPGEYVIVCNSVGSVAGHLKEWSREEWAGLIKWLRGKGVIPVQLGAASEMLLHPDVMDLRGKTSPRQAAGYLKRSKGYIGVEGGLFHLSKAVGAPAVVIFTSTPTFCYAYRDTRVVSRGVCHPCWWTDPWRKGRCLRDSETCLNAPDWQNVSVEADKMLEKGRGEDVFRFS